jgi:hypothetical protein
LAERFSTGGEIDLAGLCEFPALFLDETRGTGEKQIARVGTITRARRGVREILLEYTFDPYAPPLTNVSVKRMARELDILDFEFSRTHWALKDVDLYRVLLRYAQPRRPRPRVFNLAEPEVVDDSLISAMMPFHPSFDLVSAALKRMVETTGLQYRRADDLWEHPSIVQDIVSLIDRSKVVIGDCTGRNPNVFYEIGIAHALGREVILITQVEDDIPFDLRHLRYVHYLNNAEGLKALVEKLSSRICDIADSN